MKALLFGATGQIGREIQRCARDHGITLDIPDREIADLSITGRARAIILASQAELVINAAAYTAVDQAEREPDGAYAINAAAPAEMALACAEKNTLLMHFSTDYVFDGLASLPYKEDAPTSPTGVYGQTKLYGENAVLESGANAIILRLSWVFSAFGANFVKTMLRLSQDRKTVRVVADQIGKPTSAASVANAALVACKALKADPGKAGLYHYAGDTQMSWAEFAQLIFETANKEMRVEPVPTSDYPTLAQRPAWSVLNTQHFEHTFGLHASTLHHELEQVISALS
ncbi:MAG: dTDP-4-dehydrorhamnose reductase [Henriciella sp.]